jgi:hypothetical protein
MKPRARSVYFSIFKATLLLPRPACPSGAGLPLEALISVKRPPGRRVSGSSAQDIGSALHGKRGRVFAPGDLAIPGCGCALSPFGQRACEAGPLVQPVVRRKRDHRSRLAHRGSGLHLPPPASLTATRESHPRRQAMMACLDFTGDPITGAPAGSTDPGGRIYTPATPTDVHLVRGDPRTTRCPLAARSVSSPPFVAKGWGENTTGVADADNFGCFSAIGERGEWVSGRNGRERDCVVASIPALCLWLSPSRPPPQGGRCEGGVDMAPPSSGLRPPSPIKGEGAPSGIEVARSRLTPRMSSRA